MRRTPRPILALAFAVALTLCSAPVLSADAHASTPPPAAEKGAGAPRAVSFAILGDRTGSSVPRIYESVVDQVAFLDPAFVVDVGDHIEGYTEDAAELSAQWKQVSSILGRFSCPVYVCPGNHDITTDGQLPAWKEATGREPSYSFDRGGIHFLVLDTSRWESSAQWMGESGYADWMRKDLEAHAGAPITVVLFHKPYWYSTLGEGKPDPMHDLFRRYGVDYVFNGHFHWYGSARYDGIRYTIMGSSGGDAGEADEVQGNFFQYLWCAVRGDTLDWRICRQAGLLGPAEVTVADHKVIDRIPRDLVVLDPIPQAEEKESAQTATVSLRNVLLDPWKAKLAWTSAPGWMVSPTETEATLAPDAGASFPFQIRQTGDFYPLPRLQLDYPVRGDRHVRHEVFLPVMRFQVATRFAAAPAIDGDLADRCWSGAASAGEFGSPEGNGCVIEPTVFLFGWDESSLYLAARCRQEDGPPKADATERDGAVYRDDCVGYFLCPDRAASVRSIYQIYWNAAGTLFDQKITIDSAGVYGGDMVKWNGEFKAKTVRSASGWTFEAAIPFAQLGAAAPKPGDSWPVNFRRKEMSRQSSADWQVPIGYEPERFGTLRFE